MAAGAAVLAVSAGPPDPCHRRPDAVTVVAIVASKPFELGRAWGSATGLAIAARMASSQFAAISAFARSPDGAGAVASMLAAANATFPHFVEELQGAAAGAAFAGVAFEDLVVLNSYDELEGLMPPSAGVPGGSWRESQCTDVVVGPAVGAPASPRWVTHNEDARALNFGLMTLLDVSTPALNFTAYVYGGELATGAFGYNSNGLFFTLNALFELYVNVTSPPRAFWQRHLLESASQEDALARLQAAVPATSFAVHVGQVGGSRAEIVSVEVSSTGRSARHVTGVGGTFYHTNSFRLIPNATVPAAYDASSAMRLARLAVLPAPTPGTATPTGMLALLGDDATPVYPVYRPGIAPDCCATMISASFCVSAGGQGGEQGLFTLYANNPRDCPAPVLERSFP